MYGVEVMNGVFRRSVPLLVTQSNGYPQQYSRNLGLRLAFNALRK
jgi:hypothetical protein